jgi:ABC-type transport system involved in multi-copper enzyme maturation permease subunit
LPRNLQHFILKRAMKLRLPKLGLPMLAKELAEMAQLRRTYFVRVAFAVLMFSMSALIFLPTYRAARLSRTGLLGQGSQLLDVLYEIEWVGLFLFVPAVVSGALAAEKERNTLQLLFLTRLGPWTILLEKLLSRYVPVATFLLVSLPLLFVAYLMGGLTRIDLAFAGAGLSATAFQVGCIAIFCSAFCATSASAFAMSYVIIALVLLFPFIAALSIIAFTACLRPIVGSQFPLIAWLDSPQSHQTIEPVIMATLGIDLNWLFNQGSFGLRLRPFHKTWFPLIVIASIGLVFLILARVAIVRRAAPQAKHRIRRLFQWLDRIFWRLNDRYARGIVLSRPGTDLPENNPVAWRENRRGNLGRVNYLIRILLVVEFPILAFTVLIAAVSTSPGDFTILSALGLLLWLIAILVIVVRSAGLIAAEKARQTLDVLLTTPLTLAALFSDKMRGLFRVMFIVSVPILFDAILIAYFRSAVAGQGGAFMVPGISSTMAAVRYVFYVVMNLAVLLGLTSQLAFLFGVRAKTQGRAVTAVLGIFIAWCFLPLLILVFGQTNMATLYLSPIAGVLVNEFPQLERYRRQWEPGEPNFQAPLHLLIYAGIVVGLIRINFLQAGRVLLRSVPGT